MILEPPTHARGLHFWFPALLGLPALAATACGGLDDEPAMSATAEALIDNAWPNNAWPNNAWPNNAWPDNGWPSNGLPAVALPSGGVGRGPLNGLFYYTSDPARPMVALHERPFADPGGPIYINDFGTVMGRYGFAVHNTKLVAMLAFEKIVACALPADRSVPYVYRWSEGGPLLAGTAHGAVGLVPSLETTPGNIAMHADLITCGRLLINPIQSITIRMEADRVPRSPTTLGYDTRELTAITRIDTGLHDGEPYLYFTTFAYDDHLGLSHAYRWCRDNPGVCFNLVGVSRPRPWLGLVPYGCETHDDNPADVMYLHPGRCHATACALTLGGCPFTDQAIVDDPHNTVDGWTVQHISTWTKKLGEPQYPTGPTAPGPMPPMPPMPPGP
jgi:hypothetical protein